MTPPSESTVPPIDKQQIVAALDWFAKQELSGYIDISFDDDEDWHHLRILATVAKQALA